MVGAPEFYKRVRNAGRPQQIWPKGYAAAAKMDLRLPSNWFAAIEAFEQSEVMADYFGVRVVKMFCALKRQEQDRFFEVVTRLDLDWYLHNA